MERRMLTVARHGSRRWRRRPPPAPGSTASRGHPPPWPPSLERKARARAESTLDVRRDGPARGTVEATGEWVELDLPEEDSDRWEHMVTVPLGKPVLLNALPVTDGSGLVRALVAMVSAFEIQTGD